MLQALRRQDASSAASEAERQAAELLVQAAERAMQEGALLQGALLQEHALLQSAKAKLALEMIERLAKSPQDP